jgi:bifunctional non-homologous end joining protein LigD
MAHTGRHVRWAAIEIAVTFVAFDLLHLDGADLTGRPLVERKQFLAGLCLVGPAWATNGGYCDGDALFSVCAEHGHDGIVASDSTRPTWPAGVPGPG